MLEVGQHAPDFTVVDHKRRDVKLSDYVGHKNVVLSFHVYSFTGG